MAIQFDNTNTGVLTLRPGTSGSYGLTFPSADGANGQVLSTGGGGGLSFINVKADVQTYTTAGTTTWTKPTGAQVVYVLLFGGGGGGGSGRARTLGAAADAKGGGGGGGGGRTEAWLLASTLGATVSVTVGSFGAGVLLPALLTQMEIPVLLEEILCLEVLLPEVVVEGVVEQQQLEPQVLVVVGWQSP